MATFTIRPNAMGTRGTWTAQGGGTTNLHLSVDDYLAGGAKDDDTTYVEGPNNGDSSLFLLLEDVPAGFDPSTITAIDIKSAYRKNSAGVSGSADTVGLFYQLFRLDESTAITTELSLGSVVSGTYLETTDAMTATGTHSETDWNGVRLRIRQDYTIAGCADTTTRLRVTAAEITVTYTAEPDPISGSGTPTATLGATGSGTASQKFTGSGTPTETLGATGAGTATQKFNGSGTPTATLSTAGDGAATNTPNDSTGSGTPTATLSAAGEGEATQTLNDSSGSGEPTVTLSAAGDGTATHTPDGEPDPIAGSGEPTATLAASVAGTAVQTFGGDGEPATSLVATAEGIASMTPDGEPEPEPEPEVRRARGRVKFVNIPVEEEEKPPEEVEEQQVYIPALLESPKPAEVYIPTALNPQRAKTALSTISLVEKSAPVSTIVEDDSDDEEALIQILMMV